MTSVIAEQAELAYGAGAPALSGLDFRLGAGELVVLLGPNGGGKTTFFRALTGELQPRAGALSVTGRVAHLPQRDGSRVDFPVTALDVVQMGLIAEAPRWSLWPRNSKSERARALEALTRVGLADAADRGFGELSGGQRRRVLLARTIVGDAPIVALDEPLAGVDPHSAEAIRETLAALRGEGRLVIEASHDIERAQNADRVICLAGRVVAEGPPQAVLTESVLRETYAGELALINDEQGHAVLAAADCCDHEHSEAV